MKTLIVLACFGFGAVFSNLNKTVFRDFRLVATAAKPCTTPGLMCSDCQHLVTCVSDGLGGFNQIASKTCASGETCFNKVCTDDRNPVCDALQYYQFSCQNSGMFPDPFDCQKYHFCLPNQAKSVSAQCDAGYGYHSGSTFCQKQLTNNACPEEIDQYPVPLCYNPGETGALDENPSMYYICVAYNSNKVDVLYPFLYTCPHGGTYSNYACT